MGVREKWPPMSGPDSPRLLTVALTDEHCFWLDLAVQAELEIGNEGQRLRHYLYREEPVSPLFAVNMAD